MSGKTIFGMPVVFSEGVSIPMLVGTNDRGDLVVGLYGAKSPVVIPREQVAEIVREAIATCGVPSREEALERDLGIRFPCGDCGGKGRTEREVEIERRVEMVPDVSLFGARVRGDVSAGYVERVTIERRPCLSCGGTGERRVR